MPLLHAEACATTDYEQMQKGRHRVGAAPFPIGIYRLVPVVATLAAAAKPAAAAFFRTRLIHVERPSIQIPAIEFGDGSIAFGVVTHFNETKASGLSGVAVGNDTHAIDRAVCLK